MNPVEVVIFNVEAIWKPDDMPMSEALLRFLQPHEGVQLRTNSSLRYQVVNLVRNALPDGGFVGELRAYREGELVGLRWDPPHGWVSEDQGEGLTTEAKTFLAYSGEYNILVLWETAHMPYTRLESFARRVSGREEIGIDLEFKPWLIRRRTLRDAIEELDLVTRLVVRFRHSASPGDPWSDLVLDSVRASFAELRVENPEGLDKEALLNGNIENVPVRAPLEHVEESARNGTGRVEGVKQQRRTVIKVDDEVDRRRMPGENRPTTRHEFLDRIRRFFSELER